MTREGDATTMKLVVAAGSRPWTGAVYPTQAHKGPKQVFADRDEFLAAVARLTQWDDGG